MIGVFFNIIFVIVICCFLLLDNLFFIVLIFVLYLFGNFLINLWYCVNLVVFLIVLFVVFGLLSLIFFLKVRFNKKLFCFI